MSDLETKRSTEKALKAFATQSLKAATTGLFIALGYPWRHPDPRVNRLQQDLQARVARCGEEGLPRREVFAAI